MVIRTVLLLLGLGKKEKAIEGHSPHRLRKLFEVMTERIGIWIAATSPNILHPLWLRFRASPLSVRLARGVFGSPVGAVIARGLVVFKAIKDRQNRLTSSSIAPAPTISRGIRP
jgi:hypothetical protein